jgi:hypothetical protein
LPAYPQHVENVESPSYAKFTEFSSQTVRWQT